MKFCVCFFALIVATMANVSVRKSRIVSGSAAKKGENLNFCYLQASYYEKQITCGCIIAKENFVATSARCLVDCSEGGATNVTVYFPQKTGKDATRTSVKIYFPDGVNGNAKIGAYDSTMNTPSIVMAPNNIGLVQLSSPIVLDDKTASAPLLASGLDLATFVTKYKTPNMKFRACGVGSTNNQGDKPKGVICTDVNLVPAAECKKNPLADAFDVPAGFACFQWADRDNNLCVGDYGGSIYAYETDLKGAVTYQAAMCIAVGSPDRRNNAPCSDGHTIFCEFWSTAMYDWAFALNGFIFQAPDA